jgi:glycerol-3-phosphate dehydrogenase
MPRSRKDKLDEIAVDGTFDAIVVGGGINGAGVFRDLALQGLRVLLVERSDFCSGCSAAPSRMIHGGLRYLENGEFSLVRESLAERNGLLATAPHMVRPLPTTIPIVGIFSGLFNSARAFLGAGGKPSSRGAVPIRIGLGVYDWLTRERRVMPRHVFRGRKATLSQWPQLTERVRFSATYYDAWISYPERLGIELVADAEDIAPDSVALNYATIHRRDGDDLELVDGPTGKALPVTARVIVNATGAWLDDTREELAGPAERMVAGTKGSHLVIHNTALRDALGGHMFYFENADGRVCIVFPYLGQVLAGATDIRVDKATRVRCEDDERDYILDALRRLFPNVPLDVGDIVFSFSGIRPLPRSRQSFTGRISRDHFTRRVEGELPQICMVGGKWTTFRAFAEQTCDDVLKELGKPRRGDSRNLPIGGGKEFPDDRADQVRRYRERFGVDKARAVHLTDRYGTNGEAVQAWCAEHGDDRPLAPGTAYTTAEIDYLLRTEQVIHLDDLVLRRTDLAITGRLSLAVVDTLAAIAAPALGWTEEQTAEERAALIADLKTYHGVSLAEADDQTIRREECV